MVCDVILSFRSPFDTCKQVQSGTFTMSAAVEACDPSGYPTSMTASFPLPIQKAVSLKPPHIVQAIIFLAPLSFNQVLEEDRQVNRLEDSIYLWKEVCSNPLLARANIILFLNKMDILQKTLAAGIKVSTYVPSYGNTPNDVENVTKYFKEKFRAYHVCQLAFFCVDMN